MCQPRLPGWPPNRSLHIPRHRVLNHSVADICHVRDSDRGSVLHPSDDVFDSSELSACADMPMTTSPNVLADAALDGWRRQIADHGHPSSARRSALPAAPRTYRGAARPACPDGGPAAVRARRARPRLGAAARAAEAHRPRARDLEAQPVMLLRDAFFRPRRRSPYDRRPGGSPAKQITRFCRASPWSSRRPHHDLAPRLPAERPGHSDAAARSG
jgi:hypothetical protein